jgi:hypothetical protein
MAAIFHKFYQDVRTTCQKQFCSLKYHLSLAFTGSNLIGREYWKNKSQNVP